VSAFILRHTRVERLVERRRDNFRHLLAALKGLGGATPLFQELPPGVVPYKFPLLLHDPEKDFRQLKLRGVPIWRWEEIAVSDCPVSAEYSARLLQIPVHQELRDSERAWIVEELAAVLR
jgi:dTDP-4-amino-4,6-dideoxygalactose transaminase